MHFSFALILTILASTAIDTFAIPLVQRDEQADCSQSGSCTELAAKLFADGAFADEFKQRKSSINQGFPSSIPGLLPSRPTGINSRDSVSLQITNIKLNIDDDGMLNKSSISKSILTSTSITHSTSIITSIHIITKTTSVSDSFSSAAVSTNELPKADPSAPYERTAGTWANNGTAGPYTDSNHRG